jgi:phage terminase small subunit
MSEEKPKLNKAQEVFVSEYLSCFNATEAYSRAYPKAKRTTAGANGHELLKKTEIQDEITARLTHVHMSADEALKRLADMARGDVTEFITPFGSVDLDAVKAAGKGHLIKKIKQRTITKIGKGERDEDTEVHDTEIELHDAQAAIDKILKVHGKYKDAIELPETLKIQIVKASDATSNK